MFGLQQQLLRLFKAFLLVFIILSVHAKPSVCARGGQVGPHLAQHDPTPATQLMDDTASNSLVQTPLHAHIQGPSFPSSLHKVFLSTKPKHGAGSGPSSRQTLWTPNKQQRHSHGRLMKRFLIDHLSQSGQAVNKGEDLIMSLAGFKPSKDHHLFNMLPRAHVPPSGPSKNHNSDLTDKST